MEIVKMVSDELQKLIDAECLGLGTRLCELESLSGGGGVSGASGICQPNKCFSFDLSDWIIHDDDYYRIDVLESSHGKGESIHTRVSWEISPGLFKWVTLDHEYVTSPPGDWSGFVVRNPDCRFPGRVCFDE